MKKKILFFSTFLILTIVVQAQFSRVKSPDGNISIAISVQDKINFSVHYKGRPVINAVDFGLQFKQSPYLSTDMRVISEESTLVKESWKPVIGQYQEVLNRANEFTVALKENRFPARDLQLIFRVFNDGVAFRYVIPQSFQNFIPNYQGIETLPLIDEDLSFTFNEDHTVWAANYGSYTTHQETEFNTIKN